MDKNITYTVRSSQSNGREKQFLIKPISSSNHLYLSLLDWQNTPQGL
jgi:hypothetical protein